jgi:hypothetical protein
VEEIRRFADASAVHAVRFQHGRTAGHRLSSMRREPVRIGLASPLLMQT